MVNALTTGIRVGNLIAWGKRTWRVPKCYHARVGGRDGACLPLESKHTRAGASTAQRIPAVAEVGSTVTGAA